MFATALLSQIPTPRWLDIRFKLGIRLLKSSEFGFWKLNTKTQLACHSNMAGFLPQHI